VSEERKAFRNHRAIAIKVVIGVAVVFFLLGGDSAIGLFYPSWLLDPGEGARQDTFCRDMLRKKDHREARAWLSEGKSRNLGEQTPEDSRAIVEKIYALGALDVQAVEIERYPTGEESSNYLVVKLPADPGKRKGLFRFEARTAWSQGFDSIGDGGQQWMFLGKFKLSLWQTLGYLIRELFGR
jgi:hypothetical protein